MAPAEPIRKTRREPSRSRFHVAIALAGACLLTGCIDTFGTGITELPAERGWQPLPIGAWVLNDGLSAKAMSFCPRESCAKPGFAALIAFSGGEALAMQRLLASDPARLARDFAKPSPEAIKAARATGKPPTAKSTTSVSRYRDDDGEGLLVEMAAHGTSGKRAFAAILSGRDGDRLTIAFAVAAQADEARADARAAWRDR